MRDFTEAARRLLLQLDSKAKSRRMTKSSLVRDRLEKALRSNRQPGQFRVRTSSAHSRACPRISPAIRNTGRVSAS